MVVRLVSATRLLFSPGMTVSFPYFHTRCEEARPE